MLTKAPHREDIKAAIRKRGSTLAIISTAAGLHRRSGSMALVVPMPTANRAIAEFLGLSLHELWPQWYDQNGERITLRNSPEGRQKIRPRHGKNEKARKTGREASP